MKNRVITISREFGSGGRTIGKKVAEKLGIPCYDSEIIQKMAEETGFSPDYVKEAGSSRRLSLTGRSAPPTRAFCGSTRARSLQTLPKKARASLLAAVPTIFCGTGRTA